MTKTYSVREKTLPETLPAGRKAFFPFQSPLTYRGKYKFNRGQRFNEINWKEVGCKEIKAIPLEKNL